MQKIMTKSYALTAFVFMIAGNLTGMHLSKEVYRQEKPDRRSLPDNFLYFDNAQTNYPFSLLKLYAPSAFQALQTPHLITFSFPREVEMFIIAYLAAKHEFDSKLATQGLSSKFFKRETASLFSWLSPGDKIEFLKVAAYLRFDKGDIEALARKCKLSQQFEKSDDLFLKLDEMSKSNDFGNFNQALGLRMREETQRGLSIADALESTFNPKISTKEVLEEFKQLAELEGRTLVIFRLADKAYVPIYREFLMDEFCRNIRVPSKKACRNGYCVIHIRNQVKDDFMRLVPFIMAFYLCKKHPELVNSAVVHCASSVTKQLLALVDVDEQGVNSFTTGLTRLDMQELGAFSARVFPAVKGMLGIPTAEVFDRAESGMRSLESAPIPYRALVPIAEEIGAKYGLKTVKSLNMAIARENLRAMIDGQSMIEGFVNYLESAPDNTEKSLLETFAESMEHLLRPREDIKRTSSLAFLMASRGHNFQNEVLDDRAWKDLELFCGKSSHASQYVAAQIKPATEIGHAFAMRDIANCTSSIPVLEDRQRKLVALRDCKEEYFKELSEAFKTLAASEAVILCLWNKDLFGQLVTHIKSSVVNFYGLDKKFDCVKSACDYVNTNVAAQGILELVNITSVAVLNPAILGLSATAMGGIILGSLSVPLATLVAPMSLLEGASALAFFQSLPHQIANLPDNVARIALVRISVRLYLVYLAHYLQAVDRIREALVKIDSSGIERGLFAHEIARLNFSTMSSGVRELKAKLASSTFCGDSCFPDADLPQQTHEASHIFKYCTGKVVATFNLLAMHKLELVPLISSLGEFDVLFSSAKLVRENKSQKNNFCVAEILKEKQHPEIAITDSWNPLLERDKAVPNSLKVPFELEGQRRSAVIINGPNAAGKSSIMKGIAVAVIMAQGLGIAPASRFEYTPFGKISAYLNITDDTAGGESLFEASVNRAFELQQVVDKAKEKKCFSFTIFDEIFNGTSSLEGEAAACALIKKIGFADHNITLLTTHFKSLVEFQDRDFERFEGQRRFVNFKAEMEEEADGKLKYNGKKLMPKYKLEQGTSNQLIAFEKLREKASDKKFNFEAAEVDSFINDCEEELNRLKRERSATTPQVAEPFAEGAQVRQQNQEEDELQGLQSHKKKRKERGRSKKKH